MRHRSLHRQKIQSLALNVLGRRSRWLSRLRMVMQTVSLCDSNGGGDWNRLHADRRGISGSG